ncbi:MAG: hypothetical protein FWG10_00170 [Eubacteriaceae bacterium]|nr:hypothetical protein [Eubacteriaceae bacterium]
MVDPKIVKNERIRVFKNAARFENNEKIITVCSYHHWIVFDSNQKLSVATRDYGLRIKMMREFHERYNFDCYRDFWSRNPLRIIDAVGGGGMYIQSDDNYSSNVIDLNVMDDPDNDYDLLLNDRKKFLWTKVIPAKYPHLTDENAPAYFSAAIKELDNYNNYVAEIGKIMDTEYGVLDVRSNIPISNPFERLISGYRGIYNTSIDLRRRRGKILDLMQANVALPRKDLTVGSDPAKGCDIHTSFLAHIILSTNDFKEIYWPILKELYDYCDEYDKIAYLFIQGTADRIFDFLQDAPKGHFIMHAEQNDIREYKQKVGSVAAVAGGIKTNTLTFGTVEKNIDELKQLLDDVAYDGAFYASTDKMLTFPRDAKRENLIAVTDYIRNVRL